VLSRRPEWTTPYAEPGKRVEKIVVEILQAFLQIEQIGIHDNFFELGLTSLDLVQVNGKLHKALGNRNPVALLFEYPTVHSLSKYLEQNQGEACNPDDEPERKENLDQIKNKLKRLSSQSKRL
jgi:phthiocerol/phenolphthiocerol synthesis type-I polyketide synthase E